MLTSDNFYGKTDRLVGMYQELEDWILQDIANRLIAAGALSGTADRELWKLEQMGLHRQEIIKRLSSLTGKSRNEIRRLLKESVLTSFSNDKDVLERFANVQPPLQNNAVITAMNAELIKTYGELSNLTRTTIDQSQKDLLNMLNEVDYRVASGIQSYNSAVREVLDQYAGNGVYVNYPTGTRRSLEAAVRCCIITSMNQTAAQVTNQYIVEAGAEYVLVSAHPGARYDKKNPLGVQSHDHWQGKVYKIRGSDPDAPNLLESTGYDIDPQTGQGRVVNPLGLHGYNCAHSHKVWDKSLRNPYVDENGNPKIDIHESQELYDLRQKQRAIERTIRKTKRQLLVKEQELNAFLDDPNIQSEYDKLSYKLRLQNRKYNEFCAENDLQRQYDRVKVAGFKKEQAKSANGRATAYAKQVTTKRIPQIPASTISEKIHSGQYSTKLSMQQFDKHVFGTAKYKEYLNTRLQGGGNPQSVITISKEEAQKIIETKAGTGIIKVDRNGNARPQEQITCDNTIGQYYCDGRYIDTNKAVIHYGKKNCHIVPVKGDNYD
nr:MAG TPA: minor capsid protein [Caudoviricetes sp.]